MSWPGRDRPSAAEGLELELAGIVTDSAAAELLPLTDLLQAAARGLTPPASLRPRRRELVALGTSAARVGRPTGPLDRLRRAPAIALAVATLAVAGVLGGTVVTSWLQVTPPPISEPATNPDPSASAPAGSSPRPRPSPSEPAGTTEQTPAALPQELSAELLAQLRAACGKEATLPELGGLDETQVTALVDALVAACETLAPSPIPVATSSPATDELSFELLAQLRAACGEEATLTDLGGMDETQVRALVDALIAMCEAVPGALLP